MTAVTSKIAHDLETLANAHDSGSTHNTEADDEKNACTDTISIVFNRFVVDPTSEDAWTKTELADDANNAEANSAPEFERDKDTTLEEVKSEPGPPQRYGPFLKENTPRTGCLLGRLSLQRFVRC